MPNAFPGQSSLARDLALGFLAGALAVAIFHQFMVYVLGVVGLGGGQIYSMRGVPPFDAPRIVSQMFWGGVWGMVFAAIAGKLPDWPRIVLGFLFGVCGPVLFSWTILSLMRGNALFAGFNPARMLASVLINGFYGIGVALIFAPLRRWTAKVTKAA